MAFAGGSLAAGSVATTWGTIYGPSGVKAVIKSIDCFNNNAATQTLELRITRSGGSARNWKRATLAQNEYVTFISDGETLVLSDGDVLQAQTTTVSAVDYTITGATE